MDLATRKGWGNRESPVELYFGSFRGNNYVDNRPAKRTASRKLPRLASDEKARGGWKTDRRITAPPASRNGTPLIYRQHAAGEVRGRWRRRATAARIAIGMSHADRPQFHIALRLPWCCSSESAGGLGDGDYRKTEFLNSIRSCKRAMPLDKSSTGRSHWSGGW